MATGGFVLSFAGVLLAVLPNSSARAEAGLFEQLCGAKLRIEQVGAQRVMVKDVVGDYAQHGAEFSRILPVARSLFGDAVPIGIYPDDPDVVGMKQAKWSIGVFLPRELDAGEAAVVPRDYVLTTLPPVTAAVVDSSMANATRDGLLLLSWLPLSGYVQVAPTRMEYRGRGDGASPVTIVTPIRKRDRPVIGFDQFAVERCPGDR